MAKKPVNELKCTFLSTSQNEALARNIVSGFILPLDPDIDELADIRCAVSEAVTNCVVHAYRYKTGYITVSANYYGDRTLRLTISDKGCGIPDVKKARTPLFTTARIAGWTAHRIEELATGGRIIRPAYKSVMAKREYVTIDKRIPKYAPDQGYVPYEERIIKGE